MKINRAFFAPLLVAVVALATGGWFLQRGAGQERNVYRNAQLFEQILQYVSQAFVDEKPPEELYRMAIDGMLEELGDPHSSFLPAEDYENLRLQTQGEYGGIGISIAKRAGWITVITPLPGTPGERAGLQAGDQIVEVDGESTRDWTEDFAVSKLRGPKGASVNISIGRLGMDQPIPFMIVRDEIHVRSVPSAYVMDGDIGYVELRVFSESSTEEVRAAINELRAKGAKGVVLDMRLNSGGLLDEGVSISDLFLGAGEGVVDTRGRFGNNTQHLMTSHPDEFGGMPVVVVVGPQSASATEIVAGALQDHDRALILGRPTFGKGSVQTVFPLPNNNWLKLTTARWYTPSGRSIQRPYGIDMPMTDESEGPGGAPADSEEKPTYTTDSGRTVFGGGGISPDLMIWPDTTTLTERALIDVLQRENWPKFVETRFSFGVRYAKDHPDLKPGFDVSRAMLDEFYGEIGTAGLTVDRAAFDAGARWIGYQVASEITFSKWGEEERRRRENSDDPQVRAAVDLLKKATTPESLFALAAEFDAARQASSGPVPQPAGSR